MWRRLIEATFGSGKTVPAAVQGPVASGDEGNWGLALDAAGRIYGLKLHENKAHFTTLVSMIKTKVPNVVGVTLSACVDVMIDEFSGNQDALEIIQEIVKDLNIPIAYNFPAGHIKDNRALILGETISFEVTDKETRVIFE